MTDALDRHLAHKLNELEMSARAAGRAFARGDKEAAYRHEEDAQSWRNAIILHLKIAQKRGRR